MNYQKISKATKILGFGYFFFLCSIFATLAKLDGLNKMSYFAFFMFPALILLTIGATITRKENNFFRGGFITFIILDVLLVFYITLAILAIKLANKAPTVADSLAIASTIIEALLNVGLAISGRFEACGIQAAFKNKGKKKLANYALIMALCVNKLVLISTALPLVQIKKIDASLLVAASLVVDITLYGSYCVFMFISTFQLREKKDVR